MKVYKEEEPVGTIIGITFRGDGDQSLPDLKAEVKAWLRDNYPDMKWEEFVDRLTNLDGNRIAISMV